MAGVYQISTNEVIKELEVGPGAVTDAVWAGKQAVISSSTGTVKVFDGRSETSSFSVHAGQVTALAIHPSGEILASVGIDKSVVIYDLENSTHASQIYTDSGM